jgi:hypothetical protein
MRREWTAGTPRPILDGTNGHPERSQEHWGAAPSFLPFEHQVFRIMESEINPCLEVSAVSSHRMIFKRFDTIPCGEIAIIS